MEAGGTKTPPSKKEKEKNVYLKYEAYLGNIISRRHTSSSMARFSGRTSTERRGSKVAYSLCRTPNGLPNNEQHSFLQYFFGYFNSNTRCNRTKSKFQGSITASIKFLYEKTIRAFILFAGECFIYLAWHLLHFATSKHSELHRILHIILDRMEFHFSLYRRKNLIKEKIISFKISKEAA
jgi:hypothetical protein